MAIHYKESQKANTTSVMHSNYRQRANLPNVSKARNEPVKAKDLPEKWAEDLNSHTNWPGCLETVILNTYHCGGGSNLAIVTKIINAYNF